MNDCTLWLRQLGESDAAPVDGLVLVDGYNPLGRAPEEVEVVFKARDYGAYAVFFQAPAGGRPAVAEAFVFLSNGPADDSAFAKLHQRIWSWGGVPLIYRKLRGLVQVFRCAHKADFFDEGRLVCNPTRTLELSAKISDALALDPWWDPARLRNGTLWDDPKARKEFLYSSKLAHHGLIKDVEKLATVLTERNLLPKKLRRRLLILSLLIAYLEDRDVLPESYWNRFLPGAKRFFQVLGHGAALVNMLDALEEQFNGNIFKLTPEERDVIRTHRRLGDFAEFIEGRTDDGGQLTLWQKYSFRDLPVELISHIYQLFVKDNPSSVYTPPFLVRLMLEESLDWDRLDRLEAQNEVILDPCCGSGVFLVEAYKRLILHWRSKHQWQTPTPADLRVLLERIWGVDLEPGAIELAAFSLCLVLCDALDVNTIRKSKKLFPPLADSTLHYRCFFEAKEAGVFIKPVGVIVGNPPFEAKLRTPGARASCARYNKKHEKEHGKLPDKQVAYLFLHDCMHVLQPGGILCLLQQYNLLYNQLSVGFRKTFFRDWDVREVLDFISIRGIFQRGNADTKVLAIVVEANQAPPDRTILHATFRRTGRVDAELGFDIDYYDLHWLPREVALEHDLVWRADLLGGGRVLDLAERLKGLRTIDEYVSEPEQKDWDRGEGFIEGAAGIGEIPEWIADKPLLPSEALTEHGIEVDAIAPAPRKRIEGPRSKARFTPPMLLIREQMDIPHAMWTKDYLTYKNQVVGICAPKEQTNELLELERWLSAQKNVLQAYLALTSTRVFTQKGTSLGSHDILSLPYPKKRSFDFSEHEKILIDDIVDHYREFVRVGEKSRAMGPLDLAKESAHLSDFADIYESRINAIYRNKLQRLPVQTWPGVICQPFVFGKGTVDWSGAEALRGKLDSILHEKLGQSLHITRIARIYDRSFIFLLKPNRLRYWLRSIALRDADETLAELRAQGF